MTAFVLAYIAFLSSAQAAISPDTASSALDAARKSYDLVAATQLLDAAAAHAGDAAWAPVLVEAGLLVAELRRIEWEQLPESNLAKRRAVGEQIDAAAQSALQALEQLPKDSSYYCLRADLLGTLIRSDFRAKKYRNEMESSAAKAVELDPANARAYVSQAKPYVFAETNEGGDPMKAVELLTKALELDPQLETARCLRGLAHQKAGDIPRARSDWETALKFNPACKPAQDELKKLDLRKETSTP